MGMSMYVAAIKPADAKWKKMKAVWDSCEAAGLDIPEEVVEFFDGETPEEKGVKIYLNVNTHACISEYNADMREGYDVDLEKLPKDTKILRFYCAY
jgi:hypothetical protein